MIFIYKHVNYNTRFPANLGKILSCNVNRPIFILEWEMGLISLLNINISQAVMASFSNLLMNQSCFVACSKNGLRKSILHDLHERQGQSPYYDKICRPATELLPLLASGIKGVTSNPKVVKNPLCILIFLSRCLNLMIPNDRYLSDPYCHPKLTMSSSGIVTYPYLNTLMYESKGLLRVLLYEFVCLFCSEFHG